MFPVMYELNFTYYFEEILCNSALFGRGLDRGTEISGLVCQIALSTSVLITVLKEDSVQTSFKSTQLLFNDTVYQAE
jgi:hypothetical protein